MISSGNDNNKLNKYKMTDKELKELIEDCCNEIANKIEPLANVKSRLYTSLKPAINYTHCCTEFFCEDEDLGHQTEKCTKQCDSCSWIESRIAK
jgi:hypothetical protein